MSKKGTFKIGINNLVSWGAAVVIIGLMAKLQHWPWGDWLIVVGLGTEAILFFLLGFQRDADESETVVKTAVVQPSSGATVALDNMFQQANVSPELIGKLGDGLKHFGEKVDAISKVSDASMATTKFADTLTNATAGFNKLNASFERATRELATISSSQQDAQAYQEQVNKLAHNLQQMNDNLAKLNAVYSNMLTAMNQPRS